MITVTAVAIGGVVAPEAEAEELLEQLHLEHLDLLLVDEVELV